MISLTAEFECSFFRIHKHEVILGNSRSWNVQEIIYETSFDVQHQNIHEKKI